MKNVLTIFLAFTLCFASYACAPNKPDVEEYSSQTAEPSFVASSMPESSLQIEETSSQVSLPACKTEYDELSLEGKIETAAGAKIYYIAKDDFDGDGTEEAFALTGTKAEEWFNTQMNGWFANQNGVQDLGSAGPYSREASGLEPISVYNLGGVKKCAVLEWENSATDSRSLIYTVEKGEPLMQPIGTMLFRYDDKGKLGGGFVGLHSTYDAFEESMGDEKLITTGHTYKPYWYYWNGSEFKEYDGKEITLDELYAYNGAKEAVEQVLEECSQAMPQVALNGGRWRVFSAYRRDNGIINVNYGYRYRYREIYGASYSCLTFKINGSTVKLICQDEGYYK